MLLPNFSQTYPGAPPNARILVKHFMTVSADLSAVANARGYCEYSSKIVNKKRFLEPVFIVIGPSKFTVNRS